MQRDSFHCPYYFTTIGAEDLGKYTGTCTLKLTEIYKLLMVAKENIALLCHQ